MVVPLAHAGDFESSQNGLTKAYNEFSKSMLNDPTQDASKLSAQLVEPASKQLMQAVKNTTAQTQGNVLSNTGISKLVITPPPGVDSKKSPWVNPSARPQGLGPTLTVPAAPPVAPAQPTIVLDGSGVPREIEFSGPPNTQNPHKPPSAPAPRGPLITTPSLPASLAPLPSGRPGP